MNPGFVLLYACLMTLLSNSRELPVDSENPSKSIINESMTEVFTHPSTLEDRDESSVPRNSSIERWNHSRMLLKTTTLGYEDWWFLTSKRPFISYKDFPGRSGVASWKEINPSENRNSRKIKNPPTSAGVSSKAWNVSPHYMLQLGLHFAVVFSIFRWT